MKMVKIPHILVSYIILSHKIILLESDSDVNYFKILS